MKKSARLKIFSPWIVTLAVAALIATPACRRAGYTWEQIQSTEDVVNFGLAFVLGQTSDTVVKNYSLGVNGPSGIATDGTRLVLSDTNNHRILIWNSIPNSPLTPPDIVLGQPTLYTGLQNHNGITWGGARSAKTLSSPAKVVIDGGRLIVADTNNFRVLIWNSFPTMNHQSADVVVGQTSMTASTSIADSSHLYNPHGVAVCGGSLVVSDIMHHRVLIWNSVPTTNGQTADVVLGHANFNSSALNDGGGVTSRSLSGPRGIACDATKLAVADYGNNRVLMWTGGLPTSNNQAADLVLGQTVFTTSGMGAVTASTLYNPIDVLYNGSYLAVVEYNRHRVLLWNSNPATNGDAADAVLGQSSVANGSSTYNMTTGLAFPRAGMFLGSDLWVVDGGNHRFVKFGAHILAGADYGHDLIMGQPGAGGGAVPNSNNAHDISSGNSTTSALFFTSGGGVTEVNGRIYVADTSHNRVLAWNSNALSNNQGSDFVVGRVSGTITSPSGAAAGFSGPSAVTSDGTRLIVTDTFYNRVLVYAAAPIVTTTIGTPTAVGQTTLGSSTLACTPSGLNSPADAFSDGIHLIVADKNNNRVLIWNSIPGSHGTPADIVLGQPDFTTCTVNTGGISDTSMYFPGAVWSDGTRLVVADTYNHRVLIWSSFPTTDAQPADIVLGQPLTNTNSANYGGITGRSLYYPSGISGQDGRLYISDTSNSRILIWRTFPSLTFQEADDQIGQPNVYVSLPNNGGPSLSRFYGPTRIHVNTNGRLYVPDSGNYRVLALDPL